jgi:hypothetical protein
MQLQHTYLESSAGTSAAVRGQPLCISSRIQQRHLHTTLYHFHPLFQLSTGMMPLDKVAESASSALGNHSCCNSGLGRMDQWPRTS